MTPCPKCDAARDAADDALLAATRTAHEVVHAAYRTILTAHQRGEHKEGA